MRDKIICGDCREVLADMEAESVHCCITSPAYWGLRKYAGDQEKRWADGWHGALGLEPTLEMYVEHIVECFQAVRRVLRNDGTLWLNMGDCYANARCRGSYGDQGDLSTGAHGFERNVDFGNLKPKDLCMMPFRVYSALQADGWWLRSIIIWAKPNPMPESCKDRPTTAHEYVGLFAKSARYYYDQDAIREAQAEGTFERYKEGERIPPFKKHGGSARKNESFSKATPVAILEKGRNKRTVWTIPTAPFPGEYCRECGTYLSQGFRNITNWYTDAEDNKHAICPTCGSWDEWLSHYAAFPPKLVEPMIKAGTSERGVCSKCGAPWTRVMKKEKPVTRKVVARTAPGQNPQGAFSKERFDDPIEVQTVGWQPSCPCNSSYPDAFLASDDPAYVPCDTAPAVVLDPFAGSGTVGLVAKQLGRNYILIDCAQEYCDMAEKRIGSWLW